MGFLLPTLPQGAGREGAGAPARSAREEHQSRQGGGGHIPYLMPVLRIRIRSRNSVMTDPGPDLDQEHCRYRYCLLKI